MISHVVIHAHRPTDPVAVGGFRFSTLPSMNSCLGENKYSAATPRSSSCGFFVLQPEGIGVCPRWYPSNSDLDSIRIQRLGRHVGRRSERDGAASARTGNMPMDPGVMERCLNVRSREANQFRINACQRSDSYLPPAAPVREPAGDLRCLPVEFPLRPCRHRTFPGLGRIRRAEAGGGTPPNCTSGY